MPGAAAAASPQQPPTRPKPRAKRTRRHGCQTPWAPAQIVALGVVLLSIVVFYVFSVHELPSDLRRIVLVLVSAQVAMVTLLYVAISLLDPAHPAVIERQCQHQRQPSNVSATQSPDNSIDLERNSGDAGDNSAIRLDSPALSSASSSSSSSSSSATAIPSARTQLRCALCDATVSTGTRHCSVCRKCVAGFDHHCVYINTCIGSRNYPLFIALLTCSILLVATQLVIAGFAIDRIRRRGDTTRALVIGGLCLLPLLQLVCMVILASFHSYLFCKGLRTYEWLQRFNQKTAQRYAAKTPKWRHQNHNRPVRYPVDDDEDNDNSFSHRNSNRDRHIAGDSAAAAAPTIEVASRV